MENATQSVQILLVRRYLKRISDAICAPPHILTEAITNFTIPSDYQGLFTIYALQVIERTCTKESIIKKLERLAPVLSKAQLITVLATIDHTLEQIEIDALLALGRCDCEPYGGPVKKCGRCKVSLCNVSVLYIPFNQFMITFWLYTYIKCNSYQRKQPYR